MFEIAVLVDGKEIDRFTPGADEVRIGRSTDWADLMIADQTVSRQHARLLRENELWFLEPIKPVIYRGKLGSQRVPLANGERVALNEKVTLVFRGLPASDDEPTVSSSSARVLADIIGEGERSGRGLPQLEYPLLITGKGLTEKRVATTCVYPLSSMVRARTAQGRSPQLRIGRGEGSHVLILGDLSVSRRHAVIVHHPPDRWAIANLGRAETRLDGKRLTSNKPLTLEGDVVAIEIGAGHQFTFAREKGFRKLFRRLMMNRLSSRVAQTIADDEPDLDSLSSRARAILASAQAEAGAVEFLVDLNYSLVEGAVSWHDLQELVSELDDEILRITARTASGEEKVVFERKT